MGRYVLDLWARLPGDFFKCALSLFPTRGSKSPRNFLGHAQDMLRGQRGVQRDRDCRDTLVPARSDQAFDFWPSAEDEFNPRKIRCLEGVTHMLPCRTPGRSAPPFHEFPRDQFGEDAARGGGFFGWHCLGVFTGHLLDKFRPNLSRTFFTQKKTRQP